MLATSIGLLGAICLLEASLWIVYYVNRTRRPDSGSERPTILCVGNSITKGDGAPPGESYPELLEKLLTERGNHFRVVNGGVSNATTTLLLELLPEQLRTLRPAVVTFMVGDPNYWFSYGRAAFQARATNSGWQARVLAKVEKALFAFKTVNWLRLLLYRRAEPSIERTAEQWLGILAPMNYSSEWVRDRPLEMARKRFEAWFKHHPNDVEFANGLAMIAIRQRNWKVASDWLAKAQRLEPGRYFMNADFLLERIGSNGPGREGKEELEKQLAINRPEKKKLDAIRNFHFFNHVYDEPALPREIKERDRCKYIDQLLSYGPLDPSRHIVSYNCHKRRNDAKAAVDVIMGALGRNRFAPNMLKLRKTLRADREQDNALGHQLKERLEAFWKEKNAQAFEEGIPGADTSAWVHSELREMVAMAKASGSRVVIQAYPPLRNASYRPVDTLMPEFAREFEVPFSDTQHAFRSRQWLPVDWQRNYTDKFGPNDSHLSGPGNALVARTLLRTLDELGWAGAKP